MTYLTSIHRFIYTSCMHIAILGRQPELGMAELERQYGSDHVSWFSRHSAIIAGTPPILADQLGGTLKAGLVTIEPSNSTWKQISQTIITAYSEKWLNHNGKITLGISVYGYTVAARDVQKIGIMIKNNLKKNGVSLRLIPNVDATLNTATSHHNKLGLSANKIELLIVHSEHDGFVVAESTGAQNITALARRDQGRPKRDAFVGMLPPKLALMMVNLVSSQLPTDQPARILDPFCGTGVVLQEAMLKQFDAYGTDLSDKMIAYSAENLAWLERTHHTSSTVTLKQGDATKMQWDQPVNAVVCEGYLGQPFSAPPSPQKLEEVRANVNHISSTFLKNLSSQLAPGTPICLAVPAWRDSHGNFTHLPFISSVHTLGYSWVPFSRVDARNLLYYREDQVVARELLVLTRT